MVKWKPHRLNSSGVSRAFSNIKCSIKGRFFTLLVANSDEGEKAAFIVSKKVSKKAVERNRIKRRLRACYINLKENDLPKNKTLLFVGKRDVLSVSFEELEKEFIERLKKVKDVC